MKTIKCAVRCQYWNRPVEFEISVEDDATEDEIYEEMRAQAEQAASFEFWPKEDQ